MKTYFNKSYNLPVCKYRGGRGNIKFPCYASLKLDGELQYVIKKGKRILSVNKPKYGRWREDYPALEEFASLNMMDGIYLGELYWNEGRTKEDFYGLLRNKESNELKLALWGILQFGDEINLTAREVYNYFTWYRDKCKNFKYFSFTPVWQIWDEEELNILMLRILKEGWEGLVVANKDAVWREGSSVNWIKIKKKEREIETKNKNGKVNLKLEKYGVWV